MCSYPIYTDLDHLELFSRDRTGITNVPEGSLCYFNEGTSPIVYSPIPSFLQLFEMVLMHENDGLGTQHPHMNTLMYP